MRWPGVRRAYYAREQTDSRVPGMAGSERGMKLAEAETQEVSKRGESTPGGNSGNDEGPA